MNAEIRKHAEASRYELVLDGTVASYADFHDDGEVVTFPHTVTLPAFRGQGFAARVVRHALDDVRAAGKAVAAPCWFVAEFIDLHPEYHHLLADRPA